MSDTATQDGGETPPEETQSDTPPEETPAEGTEQSPSTEGGEQTTDPTVPETDVSDPLPEGQEAGADQVVSAIEDEQEKGYRGEAVDETPNSAYTVAGVLAGEETPESKASTPQ